MTNKIHNILVLGVLSLFLLSSCKGIEEDPIPGPIAGQVQIGLDLSSIESPDGTTYATADEDKLASLELFIFNSSTGAKDFSVYLTLPAGTAPADIDLSRWVSENIIMVLNANVLSSLNVSKDVHIVANMAKEKTSGVTNSVSLSGLITDEINNTGVLDPGQKPFVMHGSALNHNFSANTKATVSLRRNVSKVQFTVNTTDFTHGGEAIALAPTGSVIRHQMANVANKSFVIECGENPGGTPATLHIEYNATTLSPIRTGTSTKSTHNTYINENLLPSYNLETQATYVMLQIPFKRGAAAIDNKNYYKILVNAENGYRINRNTIYAISTNISILGGTTESTAVLIEGELIILPWDERTVQSDISQTYLKVATTNLIMGITHNFAYTSNATITTTKDAGNEWFTAVVEGTSNIKITATAPTGGVTTRAGSFYIVANNIKKKINITQAGTPVTDGSIKLNPSKIYISEVATFKTVALTVTPTNSTWVRTMDANIATVNFNSGVGNKSLTFTRTTTAGNAYYAFTNLNTMQYDSVQVCNLSLTVPTEILIGSLAGTTTNTLVSAVGGDANWVVKSKPTWITTASNTAGNLVFYATEESSYRDREGIIVVNHINDVNYVKDIKVKQSAQNIPIPAFDFMVVSYSWTDKDGKDLDTRTEFTNTGLAGVDSCAVGYGRCNKPVIQQYLKWGNDNTKSGGESVMVDMKALCNQTNFPTLPNEILLDMYATWYETKSNGYVTAAVKAWKGGTMSLSNYIWTNTGGKNVHESTRIMRVTKTYYPTPTTYDYLAQLKYNKISSSATVVFKQAAQIRPTASGISNFVEEPAGNYPPKKP